MPDWTYHLDRVAVDALLNGPNGVVPRALKIAATQIEYLAKTYCPVDTGRLRASITSVVEQRGGTWFAEVGTNVTYAIYVEMGTRRMAARSFLRRALHEVV